MPTIYEHHSSHDDFTSGIAGNVESAVGMADSALLMATQGPARKCAVGTVDSALLMATQGSAKQVENIGAVITIMPEGINSIGEDGWEELEFAVDSGASETVVGPDMISSAETKEESASRRGVRYEVANGVRMVNLGEKALCGNKRRRVE